MNNSQMSDEDVDSLDQALKDDSKIEERDEGEQRRGGIARDQEAETDKQESSDRSFLEEDDED